MMTSKTWEPDYWKLSMEFVSHFPAVTSKFRPNVAYYSKDMSDQLQVHIKVLPYRRASKIAGPARVSPLVETKTGSTTTAAPHPETSVS